MRRALWGVLLAVLAPATATASESNGRIAFSQDEQITTMRGDGSEVSALRSGTEPDWSPDGARIAFVRGGDGGRIWTMAPDGSNLRPLTPRRRSGLGDFAPDWSPDGSRLAFVQLSGQEDTVLSKLVVRDLATGRERALLRSNSRVVTFFVDAVWSPDGGQLAYTRVADIGDDEPEIAIYVLDVATGRSRRLIADAGLPAWSPDGSQIAFTSINQTGRGCGDELCADLHVVNSDGTGDTAVVTGAGGDYSPSWSPDGSSIVFQSTRNFPTGSSEELYAVRPDGSCLTWLTNGAAESTMADWQPGSGGVPDSLGCGAVGRQPAGLAPPAGTGWWVGPIGAGNLMVGAGTEARLDGSRTGFSLSYEDCAAFEPGECGTKFDIQNGSSCERHPLTYDPSERAGPLRVVRGTLVFGSGAHGASVDVYAGNTTVTLYVEDATVVPTVIDALRPLDWARPVGNLPPPRFPRQVLRRIDEARRAGSARGLQRRGWSSREARFLIRIARAVEPLQPLRAADC